MPKLGSVRDGYCKEQVVQSGLRGMFTSQCSFKIWKDGYCKIHHPESVAIREAKKAKLYEEKQKNDPWNIISIYREKLDKANARILELEWLLKERDEEH